MRGKHGIDKESRRLKAICDLVRLCTGSLEVGIRTGIIGIVSRQRPSPTNKSGRFIRQSASPQSASEHWGSDFLISFQARAPVPTG